MPASPLIGPKPRRHKRRAVPAPAPADEAAAKPILATGASAEDPSRTRDHAPVAPAALEHRPPGVAPLAAQLTSQALADCILGAALNVVGDEHGVDL
jgi:hypothetical protein